MKKVENISEFLSLVEANKTVNSPIRTNCFIMPATMEKYINEGRLFHLGFDKGLVFLLDEGTHYVFYYFWNKNAPLESFEADKDMIIEELNNRGRRDEYLAAFEEEIGNCGFVPFKSNLRLEMDLLAEHNNLLKVYNESLKRLEEEGLTIEMCRNEEDYARAVALWDERLELGDVPLEHRVQQPGDKLILVYDGDNIAAGNWWHTSGKSTEGRHTFTHKDYGRRGLGSLVLTAWYLAAYDEGATKAYGWTEEKKCSVGCNAYEIR